MEIAACLKAGQVVTIPKSSLMLKGCSGLAKNLFQIDLVWLVHNSLIICAQLCAGLSTESKWVSVIASCLVVLPALPQGCWGRQGSPVSQTGSSQLTVILSILPSFSIVSAVAVAAWMGSCPWLGAQVFFHSAMELAGRVTSAAWLELGAGGVGCSDSLMDF